MKRWIAMALLALSCAGAAGAGENPRPIVPTGDFDVSAYAGDVVLLDFWASWCKPCKESMPWLGEMQRKYGSRGLQIVAVNMDRDLKPAQKMLAELDEAIVVVHDPEGKLAGAYELQGMPSSFLYDRTGTLCGSHVGFLVSECDDREAELAKLLDAPAPEVNDAK